MPVNEILQFAYLTNANIISTPEYQAASWRPGGFVQGVAISPHLNKVWHQASFMAASLGEFIMNATGDDVRDDSNTAGMAAKIANAVRAIGGGGGPGPGPGGPIGVPNAPGMDGITYGLRNQTWVPVISLTELNNILAGYLPLSGGQMTGYIRLHAEPIDPMHPVNQGYLERRLTEISIGGGGGIPEAPSPGPYGRGDGRWINLDGFFDTRYLPLSGGTVNPGPIRITGPATNAPSLEFQQTAITGAGIGSTGIWRIYVGPGGNFNIHLWDGAGWLGHLSIGWAGHGVFASAGGFVTGVNMDAADVQALPGSLQAYANMPVGMPGNAGFPELILGNTGTAYRWPDGNYYYYPRFGKWRIAVGGNGNMVFQHNTAWSGDFSEYDQAFILRPDYSVEVYGSLRVDNDLTLGRMSVGDTWILRPDVGGYRNLNIGVEGGGALDNFSIYSNWSVFTGHLLVHGQFTAYQGAHIQGTYGANPYGLYVEGGTEFRGNTYFHSWVNEFWPPPGGSDPISVRAHYPGYARINYDVPGTAQWTAGVANTGQWMIACETSGRGVAHYINPDGNAVFSYNLVIGGNIECYSNFHLIGTVHADWDVVANHTVHSYGDVTASGSISAWGGSVYGAYDVTAGHIVVGHGGVNVDGGILWVANSMNAYASGGGSLHGTWQTHGSLLVHNEAHFYSWTICHAGLYIEGSYPGAPGWGLWVNGHARFWGFEVTGDTHVYGHTDTHGDTCMWGNVGHVDTWGANRWGDLNVVRNVWGANLYFLSDERRKENIHEHPFNALAAVRQVQFYDYDRVDTRGVAEHDNLGFSAQQLQPLMPEVIVEKPEMLLDIEHQIDESGHCVIMFGEPVLGISTLPMLAYLVRAVQELADEIDQLKARGG